VPHRSVQLTIGVLAASCALCASVQAAQPAQFFVVCGSPPNLPTIYFSGVLQGPTTAFAGFQAGFAQFLQQHYAYAGVVGCLPTNNAVNAQNFINTRSTALRNAKKIVVDTGWTESAVVAAAPPAAAAPQATAAPAGVVAAPPANSSSAAAAPGGSGGNSAGASQLTGVLAGIFGTGGGSGGGTGSGGCGASSAAGGKAGSSSSGAGCQNSLQQVATTLTSVFGNKPANANASAGGGKNAQSGGQDGALGGAQWQTTKLVVYGCGRKDMQVACVTELANQNQKDTLVQAGDVWTDAFIVDDRGDRHQRTTGFFLNIDGDQRQQLDISYGKTARFILMFDGVPAKVQKVALRSATGGLDVEEIGLIAANAGTQASQQH
jgi:hypothetical protein